MSTQEMPRSAQSNQGADAVALYERSGAAAYGVSAEQFAAILDEVFRKCLSQGPAPASIEQKTDFCAALRLEELALARAEKAAAAVLKILEIANR